MPVPVRGLPATPAGASSSHTAILTYISLTSNDVELSSFADLPFIRILWGKVCSNVCLI